MINKKSLVLFRDLKNHRGYPLTGEVVDCDNDFAIVKAFGLYGAGTETIINDVPLSDLKEVE